MKINNNTYTITNKKSFETISIFKKETIELVFNFAYEMSFGKGEHRKYRSGGQYNRKNGEIFINAFQGKLAELGTYNEFNRHNNNVYKKLSEPDFEVYGLNKWDQFDISLNEIKFSIKSTKYYGNLLLLETKDLTPNAEYKPNLETNSSIYDFIILVRIKEDGESIMKKNGFLYSNEINRTKLFNIIKNTQWEYDIPGFITNSDLKSIIDIKQIIPQNAMLNGKTKMDAENYYVETGNLRNFVELIKSFK